MANEDKKFGEALGLRIFDIKHDGETDTVCAKSNINALLTLYNMTDVDLIDYNETDEVVEVPKEEWSNRRIRYNEDGDSDKPEFFVTFEEYMATANCSEFMCSTVF